MTGFDLNAQRQGFAKFVTKTFLLIVSWVIVAILGLQYYIFYLDDKSQQIHVELNNIDVSLTELDALLVDYHFFLRDSQATASDSASEEQYIQEIITLQNRIQTSFSTLHVLHKNITAIEDSWPVLKQADIPSYREHIQKMRQQLLDAKATYGLVQNVNLEQLKRLLIGFGVFTSVFFLLLSASIRKRINKGNTQKGDAQEYMAFESNGRLKDEFYNKVFLYSCFQRMEEPCLVLNDKRKVVYANQAFSALWQQEQTDIEKLLKLTSGVYDEVKQLKIPSFEHEAVVRKGLIGGSTYSCSDEAIWDGSSIIGYEFKLLAESERLEYEALSKSVALMAQDVWDAPIRILRKESAVGVLALQLEAIRTKLQQFFEEVNAISEASSLVQVKKLQHILTLLQDIKRGEFNLDFNPTDVLRLSGRMDAVLESRSASEVSELYAFIEDLHSLCEHIIHGSEPDVEQQNEIADFLNSIESGLQTFVEQVQERETALFKRMETKATTLEGALERLHDAKEITLNAMNEGRYDADDIDFKQFFIDDVDSQMTAAISMVNKAFTTEKAIFAAAESEFQDASAQLKEVQELCLSFIKRKTDVDDLIDQVRFLAQELSAFDAKIKQIAATPKADSSSNKLDVDLEENGDW